MVKNLIMTMLAVMLLVTVAQAAQVTAVADRDRISAGESLNLQLRVEGAADDDPDLTVLQKDWDILGQSSSSQVQFINGHMSRSKVISLSLMAKGSGEVEIPAICFGADCSEPLSIRVSEEQSVPSKGDDLLLEAESAPETVIVGQQVLLTIRVLHRVNLAGASLTDIEPQGVPVDIQPLGKDSSYQSRRDGYLYNVIERRYAIFPEQAGTLTIPRMTLQAQVANASRFDPFGGSRQNLRRLAPAMTIKVVDKPADSDGRLWLPASSVSLTDSWQQQLPTFRVGEPVTRTLVLQAKGSTSARLPELSLPLPAGWKSYPDQPLRADSNDASGMIGTLQQKVAVVPTKAGKVTLPGFVLDWYDVGAGKWRSSKIEPLAVLVLPATDAAVAATPPPAGVQPPAAPPNPPAVTPPPVTAKVPAVALEAAVAQPLSAGFWPWLCGGLALGWLLTLLLWWRISRRAKGKPRQQDAPAEQAQIREQDAFKQLLKNLSGNDPKACRQALLEWGRCRWPEIGHNLERLGQHLSADLAAELGNLSAALYTDKGISWQGDVLGEELRRWRKQKAGQGKNPALPPLYPQPVKP